jgi:signal transduction histidine kinase
MFTELHNGKLTLISSLGEGTTVRLQFPEIRVINDEELQPQSNNNFAA